MTATAPEFVLGGAERLLRVSAVELNAQSAELHQQTGACLADPAVGVCRAALG